MIRKVLFLILILNFLQNCGFAPIYSTGKINKINISSINLNGDWELNNYIKSSLQRYSSTNVSKIYDINVTTTYSENAISKDSTGKVTNYQFNIKAIIFVTSENFKKEYRFEENFIMENFEDQLVRENYERSNKNNIANLITNKLMIQLSRLE